MSLLRTENRLTQPKVAKAQLLTAVKYLIEILDEVDQYPALYLNHRVLRDAIFRYEHRWIPLLASVNPDERLSLVPPTDIQWVWFCHMLCPVKYVVDSPAIWSAFTAQEHGIVDHKLLKGRLRQTGRERAEHIWKSMFPDEPFDVSKMLENAPFRETGYYTVEEQHSEKSESRITYDIIAASERQMAFHYQVAITPQYRDDKFLRYAVERYYDMFLFLQTEFANEIWVPTHDIDLCWHAHILHPRWYKETTERLRGTILPHDDSMNDRTTGSQLSSRWAATRKKWQEVFGVPVYRAGGMWRGDIGAEERIQRPYVQKLVTLVTQKVQQIMENHTVPYQAAGKYNEVEFVLSYGGEANWEDSKVDWVHFFDWRAANREGKEVLPGTENKVERLTFLKHSSRLILLTCRTVHFLTYNDNGNPYGFRSLLEVFGNSPNIPLATAHRIPTNSMCDGYSEAGTACKLMKEEGAFVLRVGGEDLGVLAGRWVAFEPPRKGTAKGRRRHGRRGRLQLRLWLFGDKRKLPLAARGWQDKHGKCDSSDSNDTPRRYSFTLPVLDAGQLVGEEKIHFDLETASIKVKHATHLVSAYLISMVSAALHVMLQPRYMPEGGVPVNCTETMYPEWSVPQNPYIMLRGAGGERSVETGNRGLWMMVYQNMKTNVPWTNFFAGAVPEIRAPQGSQSDGCGGCVPWATKGK